MPTSSKIVPGSLHRQYGCLKTSRLSGIMSEGQTGGTYSSISWSWRTLFTWLVLQRYKKQLSATKIVWSVTNKSNGCINVCCCVWSSIRCFDASVSTVWTCLNRPGRAMTPEVKKTKTNKLRLMYRTAWQLQTCANDKISILQPVAHGLNWQCTTLVPCSVIQCQKYYWMSDWRGDVCVWAGSVSQSVSQSRWTSSLLFYKIKSAK